MNQEENILLKFQNVSKVFFTERFQTVKALEDISFSLKKGEFLSIIGPSGCGKSTILRLVAGLEQPTNGVVLFHEERISKPDRRRGLVFQSYSAFPWLTVRKNIEFGLDSADASINKEKVSKWLDFTGLKEFADSYPKELSGGMKQRLALARSMIVEPELLLLDEPFGALDEKTRENMQILLLKAVLDSDCSVIFVTHEIREAIFLGDRVILLSQRPGKILNTYIPPHKKPRDRNYMKTHDFNNIYEEVLDSFPS